MLFQVPGFNVSIFEIPGFSVCKVNWGLIVVYFRILMSVLGILLIYRSANHV
jgi:hypothetical protein